MIWIYEPSFATLPSPHSPQSSSALLRRFLYTASDDMRTPLYDMSSSWLKYIATIENIPHSPMTSVIVGVVIDAHRTEYLFTRMRWRRCWTIKRGTNEANVSHYSVQAHGRLLTYCIYHILPFLSIFYIRSLFLVTNAKIANSPMGLLNAKHICNTVSL